MAAGDQPPEAHKPRSHPTRGEVRTVGRKEPEPRALCLGRFAYGLRGCVLPGR